MAITTKSTIVKSYCRSCDNHNNHNVLYSEEYKEEYKGEYHYSVDYMLLKCAGCETISYREDYTDYENSYPTEDGDWENLITTTTYPPYLKNHQGLIQHGLLYSLLPESITIVYEESLSALKADCKILSGVGFRAVIEAICMDKEIKGRTLENKIDNLCKDGLITKKECERLHSIRFIGNDSVHEMKVPEVKQLRVLLKIVENLLYNLYFADKEIDRAKIERPINEYPKFKKLLSRKILELEPGTESPLVGFIDRDLRKIKDKFIEFEKELVEEIRSGSYTALSLGDVKTYKNSSGNVQYYIVNAS